MKWRMRGKLWCARVCSVRHRWPSAPDRMLAEAGVAAKTPTRSRRAGTDLRQSFMPSVSATWGSPLRPTAAPGEPLSSRRLFESFEGGDGSGAGTPPGQTASRPPLSATFGHRPDWVVGLEQLGSLTVVPGPLAVLAVAARSFPASRRSLTPCGSRHGNHAYRHRCSTATSGGTRGADASPATGRGRGFAVRTAPNLTRSRPSVGSSGGCRALTSAYRSSPSGGSPHKALWAFTPLPGSLSLP